MRRAERVPWVLAALGLGWVLVGLRAAPRAEVDAPACERVAQAQGALLCDDELDAVLACGRVHALRPGDALDAGCHLGRMSPDDLARFEVPIDPNSAPASDLQSLPRIGPVLAERIIAGRPYADAEALLEVRGIGPKTLARIRPRLAFGVPRPSPPRSPRSTWAIRR